MFHYIPPLFDRPLTVQNHVSPFLIRGITPLTEYVNLIYFNIPNSIVKIIPSLFFRCIRLALFKLMGKEKTGVCTDRG